MTKYESLMNKAILLRNKCKHFSGWVFDFWNQKVIELENMAAELSVDEACKEIK